MLNKEKEKVGDLMFELEHMLIQLSPENYAFHKHVRTVLDDLYSQMEEEVENDSNEY